MGYGRSMLWGAAAGIVAVALVVAGVVFVAPSMRSPMSVPGDRVLLVVGSRSGVDGSQVAQLVAVAEIGGAAKLQLIDPLSKVAVAGTAYDRLRDAYPFGGGEGVSRAYAAKSGTDPLPVVTLTEQGLVSLVDSCGGIRATLPTATTVFDGSRLFSFEAGEQQLGGEEVVAVLSSQDYLTDGERASLATSIASGLAAAVSGSSADLAPLSADGRVTSSLSPEDLADVGARLRAGLARVEVGRPR